MLPMTPKAKKRLFLTVVLLAGLFATLKLTYWVHLHQGKIEIQKQSEKQLKELVSFLDGALSRYESIPHVLSTNPMLANVLNDQQNPDKVQELNLYLEEIQHVTEASDIYLIDALGIAIAASNWQQSFSFIGKDYSFRPYYTDAISGNLGRYYAVGTSSDKRGFYFSYPIYQQGGKGILGAIIVKVNIADIEQQSTSIAIAGQYQFLISDPEDIVFISSIDEWRLKSLTPLTQAKQYALNASKRYAERPIGELLMKPPYESGSQAMLYQLQTGTDHEQYMDIHQSMAKAGWRVHILAPIKPLLTSLPALMLLSASIYLLLALSILFNAERRRNLHRMQLAQSLLEQRVEERTQDLQQANNQLKDTQDELIQAAKLTVIGSLSASINHELNQPLAALRSYAQNTQTFLARDMQDKALDNIKIIIELTDRLADIVGQFKSFTRKSQGADSATDIGRCIKQALTIVQPAIDKQGVELDVQLPNGNYQVWGDKVRLQQVFVNIMSNAIVAMQQSVKRQLVIRVTSEDKFCISIQDSGPGVRESQMEKIFEPYFTTNERHGLGLGLSISQRIIESMQGQINVANAEEGGAIFQIILPIYLLEER
ncbi:GHKL domain-containing protein [Shewanella sp. NKUCC05_KAH]|jgi:two-component system C4-dicarboxylate transport sensor histidine kinase DctB|uniref:C4-dicarboxylate transport sensor protein DctB n=1 Tax=Shewanella oncorhynchi TaxID=2726434 RepID=A0AA50KHM9_9GAMM|nr:MULTISPECIES: ATP-binding protein [Shewanella]MBI1676633.1 sensor histidine kinase [Shewanella sp. DW31]MBW3514175.1 GHKL domain-containing protein [Shewanella sp. NKUCC01_JLK]MBW3526163.1 GHKL domain-containing protein [Shewanella sp. NKUCC05_KAH]MCU7961423.1 ATP-binding protein [Shewanella sp. SW32]MCU7969505.1 ATP-binding protein [Shewanella sp. SW29]